MISMGGRIVVGVGGEVGHGKDTVGKELVAAGFIQLALGDRIKEYLEILDPPLKRESQTVILEGLARLRDDLGEELLRDMSREVTAPCWPLWDTLQGWLFRFRHTLSGSVPRGLSWRTAWDVLKVVCPAVRGLMQRLGTDIGRTHLGEDYWCGQLALKFDEYPEHSRFVVTDLPRYKSEADFFTRLMGSDAVFLKVVRPGYKSPTLAPQEAQHSSEQMAVPESYFATIFYNVYNAEELRHKVKSWYSDWMDARGDVR